MHSVPFILSLSNLKPKPQANMTMVPRRRLRDEEDDDYYGGGYSGSQSPGDMKQSMMMLMSNLQTGQNNTIEFLKQTVDPYQFKTRPAPLNHPAAKADDVTLSGTMDITRADYVQPVSSSLTSILANTTGLVLWWPRDGFASIASYAIAPQTARVRNLQDQFVSFADFSQPTGGFAMNQGYANRRLDFLYFAKALAIPYVNATASQVKISAQLGDQFSRARGYGGAIEMWSATIQGGTIGLNGQLTTAVVSSGLGVAQTKTGDGVFSVTQLGEAARTSKEYIPEVDADYGIVSLQGPDINSDYSPPAAFDVSKIDGGWQKVRPSGAWSASNAGETPADYLISSSFTALAGNQPNVVFAGGQDINMFSYWMSPWGVEMDVASTSSNNFDVFPSEYVPNLLVDPIPEQSFLDVNFRLPLVITAFTNVGTLTAAEIGAFLNISVSLNTCAMHVFASVGDNGEMTFKAISDMNTTTTTLGALNIGGYASEDNLNKLAYGTHAFSIKSRIGDRFRTSGGLRGFGKYIGCRVFGFMSTPTDTNAVGSQSFGFTFGLGIGSGCANEFAVRCPDINVEGKQGPIHVLRYDGIGLQQRLRIQGVLNAEAVPKADVANLTQDAVQWSRMSANINDYTLLYFLYNGVSPFKCSWVRSDWKEFVKKYVRGFSVQNIKCMSDARIVAAASASGFWDDLKNIAKTAVVDVAKVAGGAIAGKTGSQIAGGLARAVTSAQGQFGMNPATSSAQGQFGMSPASTAGGRYGFH